MNPESCSTKEAEIIWNTLCMKLDTKPKTFFNKSCLNLTSDYFRILSKLSGNGKIAVYDSSAFRPGLRLLRKQTKTNPKYEQTQNTNPQYERTQNTKGFRSPRL